MFFRWVRIFVAHFLGKRNLEVYSAQLISLSAEGRHPAQRPEIKVLAVSSELYLLPAWEDFKKVIQDALMDTPADDVAKIIEKLHDKVISEKGLNSDVKRTLHILRKVLTKEKKTHVLSMHCEAVVAALLESRRHQSALSTGSIDTGSTDTGSTDYKFMAEFTKVLPSRLVLERKNFHHVFLELGQRWYGIGNKIMLPCLLGTFPSS